MRHGDLIVTWPKSRPLSSYLRELERAQRSGQVINYRVRHQPRISPSAWRGRGPRCYMVHDGAIRGYNKIRCLTFREDHEVVDPITGNFWPRGWYIVRDPGWHEVEPVPMRGFRGFRYGTGTGP